MIVSRSTGFLIVILWLFSATAFSQQKLPLQTVLAAIEKQHNVKFNYTQETLADYKADQPQASLPLEDKLKAIQTQVPLAFEILDNKYIVVTAQTDLDLPDAAPHMAFDLREVVIDNFLTSGIYKKKSGEFVVRPQQFGILPGQTEPDILQTMQQIPGVYSADESISNINVRGGTHDQNLFLWNGIHMYQTGHFFGLISAFNPALAHTISIAKNGSPAFFGESVSSVVDISTHSDQIEKTSYSAGINLICGDFFAKIKASKKASFVVSGRRSFTDAWNSPAYKAYYNRIFQNTIVTRIDDNQIVDYHTDEDFYFYDFTAQYRQKIGEKHEFFIDGILMSNELGIRQDATVNGVFNSKHSKLHQQSYGGSLHWKTVWNARHYTKINAYVSSYNLDALNQSIENNQILEQQNTVLDLGFRIENHHQINDRWHFNNGYQYNETGITNSDAINNPQLSRNIKDIMRSHALILEAEYRSPDQLMFFKGGLRNNYYEELSTFIIEPRLQFNYTLSKTLKVEVLGEQKSQSASQIIDLQRDFLGIEKRRWTLAEDDIPLQKSTQFSFGLAYKTNNWQVTLDNFYKKVVGISSPGQAFQNQLELIKINGNYTVAGSEILIRRNFDRFYGWIGYSFNRNEYRFDYFDPATFPNNFEIQHSITSAAVYEKNRLKVALGGKWNSGRPTTTPTGFTGYTIAYNDPNNRRLKDYLQFNLSASYWWPFSAATRLQASASVLNLFDRKNVLNRYYRVDTQANAIEVVNTYSMERTPNVSLRLWF